MKCKPNQLCAVNWPGSSPHNHFVTTKEFIPPWSVLIFLGRTYRNDSEPAWWVECASAVKTLLGPTVDRFPVLEKHLRPIDNPGDGEVDQSKAWLPPVPVSNGVTA